MLADRLKRLWMHNELDDEDDRVLLILESDPIFAQAVCDRAQRKGFRCLRAVDGEAGLGLAATFQPDAIVLDLALPGMSGWQVLDSLRTNPDTRHIPVHIMSPLGEVLDALPVGALDLTRPVSLENLDDGLQGSARTIPKIKTLLVVEDDPEVRHGIRQLLAGSDVRISEVAQGRAAIDLLRAQQHFDCMILDLSLPDMTGLDVLDRMHTDLEIIPCPVIVYTDQALTEEERLGLLWDANTTIVKSKSRQRLLDEASLFLQRVVAAVPEEKQRTLEMNS